MKKLLTIFVIIFLIIVMGFFLPKIMMNDGINSFSGEEKRYAAYAIYHTQQAYDDSIEQILTTNLRVVSIQKVSDDRRQCGYDPRGDFTAKIYGDYQAFIQGYTLFGIPLYTLNINCESSSRYN